MAEKDCVAPDTVDEAVSPLVKTGQITRKTVQRMGSSSHGKPPMSRRTWIGVVGIGLFTVGVFGLAWTVAARDAESPVAAGTGAESAELPSVVRGGRLYDDWVRELGKHEAALPHPSYPASGKFAKEPRTTWRCKECHGFDYLGDKGAFARGDHFTGIKGISGMIGAPPERIVSVLKDKAHGFDKVMAEQDLSDLASFVSRGQVDMAKYIDTATGSVSASGEKSRVLFNTICASCHGSNGQKIKSGRSIGHTARSDPWGTLHRILNGHPGEAMPSLRVLDTDVLVGVLAYARNLPTEQSLSSIVRGGRLYDNWYREIGKAPPEKPHPAFPGKGIYAKLTGESWRCKECHGWNYRGRAGTYGEGGHYTGVLGIRNAVGMNPEAIIPVLKDSTHRYGKWLDGKDLNDLANFVSSGQVDMDRYIDRETGASKGDRNRNVAFFATICARCHGDDGRQINIMRALGKVAVASPRKTLHTILNGHPGEAMPALRALAPDVIADILAFIQSLPTER